MLCTHLWIVFKIDMVCARIHICHCILATATGHMKQTWLDTHHYERHDRPSLWACLSSKTGRRHDRARRGAVMIEQDGTPTTTRTRSWQQQYFSQNTAEVVVWKFIDCGHTQHVSRWCTWHGVCVHVHSGHLKHSFSEWTLPDMHDHLILHMVGHRPLVVHLTWSVCSCALWWLATLFFWVHLIGPHDIFIFTFGWTPTIILSVLWRTHMLLHCSVPLCVGGAVCNSCITLHSHVCYAIGGVDCPCAADRLISPLHSFWWSWLSSLHVLCLHVSFILSDVSWISSFN